MQSGRWFHTTVMSMALACIATAVAAQARRDAGRQTYLTYCASCHGVAGKGDGPMLRHLVQAPSDLTLLAKRHGGVFPSLRVADSIDGRSSPQSGPHGTREMPVWGTVFRAPPAPGAPAPRDPERQARQRMVDLLEYLARIQER
jgi:mono/diheme cytochrome c family protein